MLYGIRSLLFWDSDFRRDVPSERDDKSAQKSLNKLFKTLKFYGGGELKTIFDCNSLLLKRGLRKEGLYIVRLL